MEVQVEVEPDFKSKVLKNKLSLILIILLLISIVTNIVLYQNYQNKYSIKFTHIAPEIAWMDVGDFLTIQKKYFVQFTDLRNELIMFGNSSNFNGMYAVYFEDLNTGAWIGINEREQFIQASLLKVPVMVAVLKKVEKGEINLEQKITLKEEDLNYKSGTLVYKGAGYELSLRELLTYLIKESDNTALLALSRNFVAEDEIVEARLAMGLPVAGDNLISLGPKQYSAILRSLYYSAYLRRTFSETALSIMSETDYNSQIPAGVPSNIPISHKVGYYIDTNGNPSYHDCGIVYHPVKPYILCVMSKGADKIEADYVISEISRKVYNYVNNI